MKNIGLIGCGNIAETYFRSQEYFNNINFVSCADINEAAANKCAAEYKIQAQSVDEIVTNDNVDIILNLTIPQAHYEVTKKVLLAGKHVYSEKPMSIKFTEAQELLNIAKEKKLYLGNAPDTFLGGGGQLSRQLIDEGKLGTILTGNFIFAFPGVQTFHPGPESWFQNGGGPVIDMGPYFFTTLVNLLGSAKNVRARGVHFSDHRTYGAGPKKGQQFEIQTPTSYMFDIEFNNNSLIQGFISFDVQNHGRNHLELYGTDGSIIVPDPNMFGGPVSISKELGSNWIDVSVEEKKLGKTNIINHSGRSNEASKQSNYRGAGLADMIFSMENNTSHRCNGELALHVLDIIESTMISAKEKREISLRSTCEKPAQFTEDQIRLITK